MYIIYDLSIYLPSLWICPVLVVKADMPAVMRYLAGCRHFDPKGRWVLAPGVSWCISVVEFAMKCLPHIWTYMMM